MYTFCTHFDALLCTVTGKHDKEMSTPLQVARNMALWNRKTPSKSGAPLTLYSGHFRWPSTKVKRSVQCCIDVHCHQANFTSRNWGVCTLLSISPAGLGLLINLIRLQNLSLQSLIYFPEPPKSRPRCLWLFSNQSWKAGLI